MRGLAAVIAAVMLAASGAPAAAQQVPAWPSFRGAAAAGVADGPDVPVEFDATAGANLAWRVEIPGLGHSSPIAWGDRVYVTSAVSEAPPQRFFAEVPDTRESIADESVHRWMLLAIDRSGGEIVWQRTAAEGVPATRRLRKGTFANATPATDGEHVVAWFGSQGLYCYDRDGTLLWQVDLGTLAAGWFFDPTVVWGTASSPVIHDGKVIVQADVFGGSFIAAFDVRDGRELWRTPREEISSWATPTVVSTPERSEIVTNGGRAVRAYDPATGAQLWSLAPSSEIAVPTPIFADGLIFVGSGYLPSQPLYAVRPGGSGDISLPEGTRASRQVAWSAPDAGPLLSTPLAVGNYVYALGRDGTLACFDAATGLPMYRERFVPEPAAEAAAEGQGVAGSQPARPVTFSASPVAANGVLYLASETGDIYVVQAGPFPEVRAVNPLGEAVFATPAIVDGMLLVRGLRHLFAFTAQ